MEGIICGSPGSGIAAGPFQLIWFFLQTGIPD